MLNSIIRFALRQRLLVVVFSLFLLGFGGWQTLQMDIDVFPNLNRPRVVVMTEAPGMAPEEVESLITFPLETAINGANGVEAVRSSAGVGISVIYVEFDWGTNIYNDRQIVMERLQLVQDRMPEGVRPQLAPISSIMGQIIMIGMWSEDEKTSPLEVRTLADWVVRQRLLTIPGVSQVFTMGGGRMQYQVLVDPDKLLKYGVTLHDVKRACAESNENATGGYLDDQGPNEFLVRAIGRVQTIDDLKKVVVIMREGRPVRLSQVAKVMEGPQVKRGDSSAYIRNENGEFSGGPAVVLTVNKQPTADTREVTDQVMKALEELKPSLPDDIRIQPELYSQKAFIDRAIENVIEALRDGGILVVIILFLFLMNFRTTFITLTAIPLSLAITALVFTAFGLSINTMTLGGLAVAIGELVDDAIVDVENIFRRLRENRHAENPKPPLLVVFQASVEIRNSIVFGTMIVVLVFIPLFALSGMEGRLFAPLGVAYIVSILSSLLVSLTLTPVLSYWLLSRAKLMESEKDGPLLRFLKWAAGGAISLSLRYAKIMLLFGVSGVAVAFVALASLERDFLPPFNEGVAQLNVVLPPGTALKKSNEIAKSVNERLMKIEGVEAFSRRTGRAELDEHAEGVNVSEMIISFDPESDRGREVVIEDIRHAMEDIPGIVTTVEQPLAHLISHMISGVKAQVGIKIYGDDLNILRQKAQEMAAVMREIEGVTDLLVEPQVEIPQLRIQLDRDQLELYGLTPSYVNEYISTAMNGEVVSSVLLGQRTFDLLVRMDEKYREDMEALKRLSIDLPNGGTTPLSSLAKLYKSSGPNTINRELVRRRIVIQCNVTGRGLVDVVAEMQLAQKPVIESLPSGYFVEYGGQFESEKSASRTIGILFGVSMFGVLMVLYTMFRSINFSLQVMMALPMAFIGSVIALLITGQTLTVAAMVGFISLGGIASRNGILLLNHYLHLVRYEGESWSKEMIIRAGQERLAPVLMTALTSGIGLVPLALSAGEPGKEILYPVATVILGGLISSTILEFFIRPALLWTFGRKAGERIVESTTTEIPLMEESLESQQPVHDILKS
ncbi:MULTISPECIES: efflux RND transporter permease subunit [Gimesia]|jgi:HME family heavy-metal exporter|uniref:Efflux RND transporter permease subunit n=2 Tax=Gimesia TaxID=1649453 RepID=A0A6I6AKJ7_9PLAN|nr:MULTISPECIES: efflux RND transporter permease subunit [Gimesia]MBP71937.1 CusA/CzcA family heavy metal efflux RND transporter [Haliea sp.]HAH49709.1 CusA/CzcA family heavy metal efflux RND transporter [Planctomycetaceae bacterium]MAX38650.1 CusA/CzcA family heavy metal efflux RND transporter [Gimesia sp.]QDT23455.1 Cobalt-zinc-cadmium resistance protein CzcA [Gimesia chilikensis]QGQ25685.1 efflux RND transporter permease subunit [Gimesia benthica]|tara:strand:+ start:4118 stop:7327 length:3210 start_codon:yes stop_codon:yes gene_type:complete